MSAFMIPGDVVLKRGDILITADETQPALIYEDKNCLVMDGFTGYAVWELDVRDAVYVENITDKRGIIKVTGWASGATRTGYIRRSDYKQA